MKLVLGQALPAWHRVAQAVPGIADTVNTTASGKCVRQSFLHPLPKF